MNIDTPKNKMNSSLDVFLQAENQAEEIVRSSGLLQLLAKDMVIPHAVLFRMMITGYKTYLEDPSNEDYADFFGNLTELAVMGLSEEVLTGDNNSKINIVAGDVIYFMSVNLGSGAFWDIHFGGFDESLINLSKDFYQIDKLINQGILASPETILARPNSQKFRSKLKRWDAKLQSEFGTPLIKQTLIDEKKKERFVIDYDGLLALPNYLLKRFA